MLPSLSRAMSSDSEDGARPAPKPKKGKKPAIEETYQIKTQLEHILLRPDTYIGSVEPVTEKMWVYDVDQQKMLQRQVTFVPGLYKIFDEILVNAADNKQRDKKMDCIKITIDPLRVSVWNNGKGIPVEMHSEQKMFVPSMIFGHLLTSSNFNDEEEKVTGGRNGYGAKLCNIFSNKFTVWSNNMSTAMDARIADSTGEDYTRITFQPDLAKFKMVALDRDIVDLMSRRAYDIAATTGGVKVYLNDKRVPNFKDYVELCIKEKENEDGTPPKINYEKVNEHWEVAVTLSDAGFQQISFVNSIATTKQLNEVIKKKNKGGLAVKPFQIKNHMWVFVNCLVVMKSGITEAVLSWAKFKAQTQLEKVGGKKKTKLKGVAKLEDANEAGGKNAHRCTLILTEGDSAKSLAVSGLGVVGRDHYGVFPLRGKLLNVREASHKQIMENIEINNIIKIVGLQYKKKYNSDGSHIKGLVINFLHHNWPELLRLPFLEEFITPIVKASKKNISLSFYSIPEFEEWKKNTANHHTYNIKYYKGLGTSTSKEAKEYFEDMARHRIKFKYSGDQDDTNIRMAFSKKCVEQRKEWLTNWMGECKRRREMGLPDIFLYEKDTKNIHFSDFVNKELVMFTCFKRNDKREIKVAQLAGSVAEHSAYHHGEASLMSTIINLAQNYVGSNNINLLLPNGQFGTRLQGGKDAASPRYIFTMLNPITRAMFNPHDEPLLTKQTEDNQRIEPMWYCPIIPMVLVNGSDGIGTGWMTKIPNYNPREIVENLKAMMRGEEPTVMVSAGNLC
ncbi:hypothetical protein B566_EDAN014505 [Ephemera danica]|nr:hypothetical protein B566_EDAN014505 [Ephemera danica]